MVRKAILNSSTCRERVDLPAELRAAARPAQQSKTANYTHTTHKQPLGHRQLVEITLSELNEIDTMESVWRRGNYYRYY